MVKEKVIYIAEGLVLGKDKDNEEKIFFSRRITAKDMKELDEEIKMGLKEGWLDKDFGFQELLGALMEIEKRECIKKGNKWYCNSTYKKKYYGNLSRKQKLSLSRAFEYGI